MCASWKLPAVPDTVRELRHRAAECASAMGASVEVHHAVTLAVSEVVTNAVVHAYVGKDPGPISMRCRVDDDQLIVEVADEGAGISERRDSPGVGQGLALVGAVAASLAITARPDGPGTVVTMAFGAAPALESRGLEPLCALALERLADVSNLDIVSGGVLRRVAAEVAGDPGLTEWLLGTAPRAKPGTATWQALRGGGAQLVVHDPTVPRSPGGTGEQLGLVWWVSVPLEAPDGSPAALWGLGGRKRGRPVPSERVIRALADAARTDLSQAAERAALRARLRQAGS